MFGLICGELIDLIEPTNLVNNKITHNPRWDFIRFAWVVFIMHNPRRTVQVIRISWTNDLKIDLRFISELLK